MKDLKIPMTKIVKLTITVTKTSDGMNEYVQIMSEDQFFINVVLIADKIVINDARPKAPNTDVIELPPRGQKRDVNVSRRKK